MEAGLSQKLVASNLGWSYSKVSRIESGAVSVTLSDVRAMFSLFGASEAVILENVDLCRKARMARSWQDYADVLAPEYMNFMGKEQAASHALKYEVGLVPGLFQTEDYSRSLFAELGVDERTARRRSEVRQLRSDQLLREGRTQEVVVVVSELALVQRVGSASIMRQQIEYLVELCDHERVHLLLMPFTAGAHPGVGTPFTVLQFREDEIQSALYLEDGLKQTTSVEDSGLVEQFVELFDGIVERAERTGAFAEHASRILQVHYG